MTFLKDHPFKVLAIVVAVSLVMIIASASVYGNDGKGDYAYIILVLVIIIAMVVVMFLVSNRTTEAEIGYDGLHVYGPMLAITIPYSEIRSTWSLTHSA